MVYCMWTMMNHSMCSSSILLLLIEYSVVCSIKSPATSRVTPEFYIIDICQDVTPMTSRYVHV